VSTDKPFFRVSVLIISRDEVGIDQTLDLLLPQCLAAGAECIIVDSSSVNFDEVRSKHSWATWIDYVNKTGKRFTIPDQRNIAVKSASGKVFLFCDAGSEPSAYWLENLARPLLSGEVQLVGGPIYASSKDAPEVWHNRQNDGEIIRYPTTANLGLTRAVFDEVGGFDESLNYGSDLEIVWRLNKMGIQQYCVSEAIMGLDGGDRSRERRRSWRYGKALVDVLSKHPNKIVTKMKMNPEIAVYPALIFFEMLGCISLLTRPAIFFSVNVINCFLLLRNRKANHPLSVLLNHYIYALGMIYQAGYKPANKIKKFLRLN
jgi:glycosyltransferase involved in cell wall biosynthesis